MNTIEIGIIGKPNTGKSTLFSAITLTDVPIANYPFTTLDAHTGIGYVRVNCVCTEFGVKDNPKNSYCIDGKRFIPIKVIDTAGLVRDAWKGRGLGNLFLDKISRADALIHVLDASGSTNEDGEPVPPGTHDPVKDVELIHNELVRWVYSIIIKDWSDIVKKISIRRESPTEVLFNKLSGLKFSRLLIATVYDGMKAEYGPLNKWDEEQILLFAKVLLERGKPIVIAANKIDYSISRHNIKRLEELGYRVFPISALAELILRKLSAKGLIKYVPGDEEFRILDHSALDSKLLEALRRIKESVLEKYGSTGVQHLLNYITFNILDQIVVYPVRDPNRLSDKNGNVLPDAYIIPKGTRLKEFAYMIHSELGERFLYGIDVRNNVKLKADYMLQNNDVVSIVTSM